ncbi:MAG: Fic family protein [Pseudomonadales bacterium]|nr:Fic family protein [Pseudomonadales bacterium]
MALEIRQQLEQIVAAIARNPAGIARGKLAETLTFTVNSKTLQRRLASLVNAGRILKKGDKKATRYYPLQTSSETSKGQERDKTYEIFSQKSQNVLIFLDIPHHARERLSYKRAFLEEYVPNETTYVPKTLRAKLFQQGKRFDQQLAAGTYARQICQRLLIDLAYNSSRLEGNTYSRLDTQKLVEQGVSAEGKVDEESVMIMNHKEALLFLVENAQDVELNSLTIRNLHNLLSQDLLANAGACGNIRTIEVDIGKSTYQPLGNPHVLRELFELILFKARKIKDPFEQSFFLLIHLSYLQAFEDVNKRTSRLSCNIPFIKINLCPLSFTDVSRDDYTAALLAIYEKHEISPMLDLYCWAYIRSCKQYSVVKKSLGEIDAYRIQYRQQKKQVMGLVVKQGLHGKQAEDFIEHYGHEHGIANTDKFTAMTLAELSTLHAGAIIGLSITEGQFDAWKEQ